MCIIIGESQKLNRDDAKQACNNIGDTLVIIDSHEKTIFVESVLLRHSSKIYHFKQNNLPVLLEQNVS